MNTGSQKWISRKEIAQMLGRNYRSVANSECYLGLSIIRVRVNRRVVLFPRERALEILKKHNLI